MLLELELVTSAPTVSMASSRAINVTAGMSAVTMASATNIITVPLTRPTSTFPLATGTTGTVSSTAGPHMHMSPAGGTHCFLPWHLNLWPGLISWGADSDG